MDKQTQNQIESAVRYNELLEKELQSEKINRMRMQNEASQVSTYTQKNEQSLAALQLELREQLEEIFHALSGHQLRVDDSGNQRWVEPEDDRLKIFSEYGVKQIMSILCLYVNIDVLLSNFPDEKIINWKVLDFSDELSDLILARYEQFFYYPSPEELFETYYPIIDNKISEDELYNKCVQWSREELQSKFRHYPILCQAVVNLVHATMLRALRGDERRTLRQIMHISQTNDANTNQNLPKPKGSWNSWSSFNK